MISLIQHSNSGKQHKTRNRDYFLDTASASKHTHTGDGEMNTIINRLSELSDALHEKSLHPEAEVVQAHISLLTSDKYHETIENGGIEAILIDLTDDF